MKHKAFVRDYGFIGCSWKKRHPAAYPEYGVSLVFTDKMAGFLDIHFWRWNFGVSAGIVMGRTG